MEDVWIEPLSYFMKNKIKEAIMTFKLKCLCCLQNSDGEEDDDD